MCKVHKVPIPHCKKNGNDKSAYNFLLNVARQFKFCTQVGK